MLRVRRRVTALGWCALVHCHPAFSGIWPAFADGTDINSVARTGNRKAIATADDFGRVKVFRYPCVEKGSMSLQFKGPCLCCRGFA